MHIEIWSDVACPFSYLGDEYLRRALADFEHRSDVLVGVRSFELEPQASRDPQPMIPILAAKYRTSEAQMAEAQVEIATKAAEVGLPFDAGQVLVSNTLDAHRLIHLGSDHGMADQVRRRLMEAQFGGGVSMSDHDTIATLAIETGLPEHRVYEVLRSDEYLDAVREDERLAGELGVTGIPYFLFDEKYAVAGAQPIEFFQQVLGQVWAER
ncbi:DsbA family protein [Skermania piniformis]|uniref:DsbA family oxidoreductase n=1 Tax=Skermania pinensis TaxID=39122 RepID=A0ABX8S8V7_9ACTN|nr:DsbA family oxidoreductase [Skermania piniformis]QXQ14290.1 DsbA family oxidoreductase [Skermania piniformis]